MRDNGRVSLYRDDGIVLRTQKLGEADRIVTLLTRRNGRVRAVGKGVRRTKSRFGARLEPFTHVDLLLYTGRSLDVITQAETVRAVRRAAGRGLPAVHQRHGHAGDRRAVHPDGEGARSSASSCCWSAACGRSASGAHDPRLVLDAYLLRTLAVAGYAPALDECAVCGTPDAASPGDLHGLAIIRVRGRRADLPVLPAAGRREPRGGDHGADAGAAARRLGAGRRQPAPGTRWNAAAWWPPTCSGTSSTPSVRSATWSTCEPPAASARRTRIPAAPRPPAIPADLVPRHVALVMDGNGRWAKERGLPRTEGHKMGEAALFDVIMGAIELGIPYLSAYAFSTENWRRSPDEVRFLMGFNRDVIRRRRDQLNEVGVRVRWAGRRPGCGAASSRSSRTPSA